VATLRRRERAIREGKKWEGKEVKRGNIPEINFSASGPHWVIHIPQPLPVGFIIFITFSTPLAKSTVSKDSEGHTV